MWEYCNIFWQPTPEDSEDDDVIVLTFCSPSEEHEEEAIDDIYATIAQLGSDSWELVSHVALMQTTELEGVQDTSPLGEDYIFKRDTESDMQWEYCNIFYSVEVEEASDEQAYTVITFFNADGDHEEEEHSDIRRALAMLGENGWELVTHTQRMTASDGDYQELVVLGEEYTLKRAIND